MKNPASQSTGPVRGAEFGPTGKKGRAGGKANLIFLGVVCAIYLLFGAIDSGAFVQSLGLFSQLLIRILPVLAAVYILMFLFDLLVKPKSVVRYLGKESGIKGYLIAIIGGILSAGPIYVWYSLLSEMKKKGMKNSLVAVFLYNRAIKLPLLPLLVYYFGGTFTITITFNMILFSILIGLFFQASNI